MAESARQVGRDAAKSANQGEFGVAAPAINLPKGGGAVRGIGEKFSSNPVNGTGSLSVPIVTSPGRSGFGPQLSLSYDSGSGNGPFGIGWSLSQPSITRKTDKGLPRYLDADESDVFVLSGAEDLVPVLDGEATRDGYRVKRYRPRVEGLFARIERWTRLSDGDAHWRSISKDNVLTVYGSTAESRIVDPANPTHIFSWLICQTYDDKGNAVVYEYVAENEQNIDTSRLNERNRSRSANRYLKYIRYGNRQPLLIDTTRASFRHSHTQTPDLANAGWMFEIVFDYGEGHYQEAPPDADERLFATASAKPPLGGTWPARLDPFSTYRSCFEVRSYRLCRRVLVFHHFPDELGSDDYLVRSTDLTYRERPSGSFIVEIAQSGYKRLAAPSSRYLKRSLPPLELEYSVSPLEDLSYEGLPLQQVDEADLQNLPAGLDGGARWIDLDGEGISGILSEQADAWFYKPNLGEGRFGAATCVSPRPSLAALTQGRQQLLDLAGDGALDLVSFDAPLPGFFSRSDDVGWERFREFAGLPALNWQDPNLRFVDLTGDGHADVLITDDDVFLTWYESKAESGFGSAQHVPLAGDEEAGPRLIFADGTQSIYLADMSGDGLSDLVRIRVSDICYWPNLGYGRFGAKVTLDDAPWLDDLASFDQRRVHLTDTDGSGPTDIVYLGTDGVRIYLNQHGNGFSEAKLIKRVPRTDNLTSVSVVDFLGRGTACLVWSSPLAGDARRSVRYIDLMGGTKPHLLTTVRNNLGAETHIEYASSTQFYLADKAVGTPWVTRLPFPVHVVTKVETRDLITGNRFVSRTAYHHGHFDGVEREFRGFARVEQWDAEEFGVLSDPQAHGAFQAPPVLTKTWFHTGAYFSGERVSRHLETEYWQEEGLSPEQRSAMLLPDTVLPAGLSPDEAREAVRSLKGAILRQETYALDHRDAFERPYSVSERNYTIRQVQPRSENRCSVFLTHARETIDFHYERKLFAVVNGQVVDAAKAAQNQAVQRLADPRVTHGFTLEVDDYGNVLRSASVGYGRRFNDADAVLTEADRRRQKQLAATLTETSFTNAVLSDDAYRAPATAETQTYELFKLRPQAQLAGVTNLFELEELQQLALQSGDGNHEVPYEDVNAVRATGAGVYRRLIAAQRTRYRSNNLGQLLPTGTLQSLALSGEAYKLAFTAGLLATIYQRPRAGLTTESLLPNPGAVLSADGSLVSDRGGYAELDGDGRWWLPSGRIFFHPNETVTPGDELTEASSHFFLPRRFRNAFSQSSIVDYANDLFTARNRDALGNVTEALHDYRALQPQQLTDCNGNRSFVAFDALGLAVAAAVRGKSTETSGDSLDSFDVLDADPTLQQLKDFAERPADSKAALLKDAGSRFVYDLDAFRRQGQPPMVATVARETHVSELGPQQSSPLQVSFVYSDGFGRELQSKTQAEPGSDERPRWVGKGRTVYNNKGKPVKQYEPFFSATHTYEADPAVTDQGVTAILLYDPVERVVATLHPNHSFEKVVFDPWRQETWDVNDTVLVADPKQDADVGEHFQLLPSADYLPTWREQRKNSQKGADEQKAAEKAERHAATPAVAFLDALGRTILTVADNGKDAAGVQQRFATRVTLDIEGNQREVRDSLNRVVMRYEYDLLGNRLSQASMEAGQRWTLNDVMGKPIRAWDSRGQAFRTEYDELRRPHRSWVRGADVANPTFEVCFEQTLYAESTNSGLTAAQAQQANLRGKPYRHHDTAGVTTTDAYDFKGNLLGSRRQLLALYKSTPNWALAPGPALDGETFASSTRYDALNRPIQMVAPHSDAAGAQINVIRPGYNEANLLERVDVWLSEAAEPTELLQPATANLNAVANVDYDAKGQRTRVEHGNGAVTEYSYDAETFRLARLKTGRTAAPPQGFIRRLLGPPPAQVTAVLQDLFYTYDAAGNITRVRDDAQQTIYFNNQVVAAEADYDYDATYRLVKASGREHIGQVAVPQSTWNDEARVNLPHPHDGQALRNYTEEYDYDAVGNFEQLIHRAVNGTWTRAYAYTEASLLEPGKHSNRLGSTRIGALTETYAHDAHGNMTNMAHLSSMVWDFRDQLQSSSRQAVNASPPPSVVPETTFYVYDAGGERVRKVTERQNGTRKSERIYLGGFELYREFDSRGEAPALERETLHIMDDKHRVALVETRTQGDDGSPEQIVRYQFSNHLSSASLELDDSGNVISYEEYTPYGSTSYQAVNPTIKAAGKRYRYTGKERDEETAFGYHGARYYAPWLARWASSDPLFLPSDNNSYRYVSGSPITFNDPTGLYGWKEFNQDTQRFNRAVALLIPPVAASQAVASAITSPLTAAITGKVESPGELPARELSVPERIEAATDALTAATPLAPLSHASKSIGNAVGGLLKGTTTKEDAGLQIAKTEPTGLLAKTVETAEALDRAEVARNSGRSGEEKRAYIDAGLGFVELVQSASILVLGLRSGNSKTGGEKLPADYDAAGWAKYYESNPKAKRSVGAAAADDPTVFSSTRPGRTGGQQRLHQIAENPNTSSADRGWINQERNAIDRGKRSTIRNPPGRQLAHTRGREAAKGYDHLESPSNLQDTDLHKTQHVFDDKGRRNKERP